MSDGDVGSLPPGWASATIGQIVSVNPRDLAAPPHDNELVSFVPMAAVEAGTGRLDASNQRRWSEVRTGFTRFQEGDVLFAKITPSMENGKCAMAAGLVGGRGAGSTEFHVLRSHGAVLPELLVLFLLQESVRRDARARMKGVAGQLRVPPEFIETKTLSLPPLPEQHRIVAEIEKQLTRLDAAVAALERARANLKRYRASVLQAACEGRLVSTEAELARAEGRDYEPADQLLERILQERRIRWEADQLAKMRAKGKAPREDRWKESCQDPAALDTSNLPVVPEGWSYACLGQLLSEPLANGRSVRDATEGFPVLRLTAITGGRIDVTQCKTGAWTAAEAGRYLVQRGDFLVARGNGSLSLVGRGGLVDSVPDPLAYPDTLIRVRINEPLVAPQYLRIVWDSGSVRRQIESCARTTAGIYKINQQDMRRFVLALPPLAEQQRIVAEVESRLSVIDDLDTAIEHSLRRADRLRQGVLKRAFEGKLVPQDPSDEPASVLLARIRAERSEVMQTQASRRGGSGRRGRRVRQAAAAQQRLFDREAGGPP